MTINDYDSNKCFQIYSISLGVTIIFGHVKLTLLRRGVFIANQSLLTDV